MASLAVGYPKTSVLDSIEPFHRGMAGLSVGLLALDLMLARMVGLEGFPHQLMAALPGIAALLLVCGYCQFRGLGKLQEISALGLWAVLLSHGISIMIQAAGRSPAPLLDAQLARIDHAFGFSTPAIVAAMTHVPALRSILALSYDLVLPLILMALFIPVLTGHAIQARRYILGVVIASAFTAVLFAFFPAAGAWMSGAYQPVKEQANVQAYLKMLKSGSVMTINPEASGVVSFPSFHVVLALLPVFALWPIRRMRIPMVAIATLVSISTITTGWHYGIDVAGGLAIALITQKIATSIA